jgi:hypothetical protein
LLSASTGAYFTTANEANKTSANMKMLKWFGGINGISKIKRQNPAVNTSIQNQCVFA